MPTDDSIRFYHDHGYLVEPARFAAAELEAALALDVGQLEEMSRDPQLASRVEVETGLDGRPYFVKLDGAAELHPGLATLCRDPRLTRTASCLLGEPAVLFKDKFIFKPPLAVGFPPHQDMAFGYHRMITRAVSCMIAWDAAGSDNGCLEVVPGEHRKGYFAAAEEEIPPAFFGQSRWLQVPLAVGDVLFFDGMVPHRSQENRSPGPRRAYVATYAPASDGDQYAAYYAWRQQWVAEDYPVRFAGDSDLPSKTGLS